MVSFRVALVIAVLGICGMSASAQDKPAEPSKLYTNDDLVKRSPSAGCQSERKYDSTSGDTHFIERCPDGMTRVRGSNTRTGATWNQTIHADGSQSGTDRCGYRWTYDVQTKRYANENGETRVGEEAFRARLEAPMTCAAKPVAARPPDSTSNQPFCTDTSRTDTAGNSYARQRCLDGTVRESGTDLRNGTIREWRNTIHPDGSQSGENGCGVSWKYDAKTDRFETSIGENGMGKNVFLANLERMKKCDVYVRP